MKTHLWYYSVTTILVCTAIASVLAVMWLATNWLKSARAGELFRTFSAMLMLPMIILLCAVGALAGLFGVTRLDNWCARQLTDTDGQPE